MSVDLKRSDDLRPFANLRLKSCLTAHQNNTNLPHHVTSASSFHLPPGVVQAFPVLLPTFTLAAAFGVLAAPLMGPLPAMVMSAIVFAGSAQFAALGVLTAGGGAAAAVIAGTLTNSRFFITGFAVASSLTGGRVRRALEGQAVIDTSFAIAGRGDGTFDRSLLLWSAASQYFCWLTGTATGVLAADDVPDPRVWGLDVIMPAFFISLLVAELRRHGRRAVLVAGMAVAIALLSAPLLPAGAPIALAAVAAFSGLWVRGSS